MSHLEEGRAHGGGEKKYKGVRRRKGGKWVSEIRVPGTKDRLWLGSYCTPEAAAIAHDTAQFCLRGPSARHLNFPTCLPTFLQTNMSPKSVQTAASNAAMAIDAELLKRLPNTPDNTTDGVIQGLETQTWDENSYNPLIWDDDGYNPEMYMGSSLREWEELSISIEDMEVYY